MESGLVNLRAELHKKKLESSSTQLNNLRERKGKYQSSSSNKKCSRVNKSPSLSLRKEDDSPPDNEESLKLEQSRKILEEKAKLYDKLKDGTKVLEDDNLNQRFLINFQNKIVQEVTEKRKESERKSNQENEQDAVSEDGSKHDHPSHKLERGENHAADESKQDMVHKQNLEVMMKEQEKLLNKSHEKWGNIEENSKQKDYVHYQDVLFDEARSHGVGFMQFSRDEAERRAQHELLNELRAETIKVKSNNEAMQSRREKLMKERLTKVRHRKRLKMGLPMKEMEEDKLKTPPASDDEEVEETKTSVLENTISAVVEDKPKMNRPVREWDLGKLGSGSVMSQQQWVESERKIRETAFAPPSFYETKQPSKFFKKFDKTDKHRNINVQQKQMPENKYEDIEDNFDDAISEADSHDKNPAFAPPPSYEYYGPSTTRRHRSPRRLIDLEASISKGLSNLRKQSSL